jgi:DNA-binding IscR family transcriptional regulator
VIEQLLEMVAEGGIHSYEELVRRLSVSQPLLEAMLEDLSRLGYLSAVQNGCGGHCAGCSASGCSVVGAGHLWILTEKGARAATRLRP